VPFLPGWLSTPGQGEKHRPGPEELGAAPHLPPPAWPARTGTGTFAGGALSYPFGHALTSACRLCPPQQRHGSNRQQGALPPQPLPAQIAGAGTAAPRLPIPWANGDATGPRADRHFPELQRTMCRGGTGVLWPPPVHPCWAAPLGTPLLLGDTQSAARLCQPLTLMFPFASRRMFSSFRSL